METFIHTAPELLLCWRQLPRTALFVVIWETPNTTGPSGFQEVKLLSRSLGLIEVERSAYVRQSL